MTINTFIDKIPTAEWENILWFAKKHKDRTAYDPFTDVLHVDEKTAFTYDDYSCLVLLTPKIVRPRETVAFNINKKVVKTIFPQIVVNELSRGMIFDGVVLKKELSQKALHYLEKYEEVFGTAEIKLKKSQYSSFLSYDSKRAILYLPPPK